MYRGRSLLAGLASAVAVACLLPAAASAAIINVTTQSDETNSSDGLCSLREAITSSNNSASPDPACPVKVHTQGLRQVTKPYVLKVCFTDLGQCAAVVLRKFS